MRPLEILAALLLATAPLPALGQGSFGSSPSTPPSTPSQPAAPRGDAPARQEPARQDPPRVAAELPTAADIFKRSVEAIGGQDAIRRHTSLRTVGKLEMPGMPEPGRVEMRMLAPNRFLTAVEMGQMGRMEQGFDGTVGWTRNPMMGTQLLKGATLDELRRQSDFYKDLDPANLWDKATTIGVTDFAGFRCHEVKVEGDLGDGSLFYGVDDGLMRGMRLSMDTPMGKVPAETRMLEYKPFDGWLLATRTEISAMNATQVMTVESVSFDPIDPTVFDLPVDVKALVAAGDKPQPPKGKPSPPPTAPGGGKP